MVRPEIIERMVFEAPGTSSHWWDVHEITIDNTEDLSENELSTLIPWEEIVKLSTVVVRNPASMDTYSSCQELNKRSLLHELDLQCRKIVANAMAVKENQPWSKAISAFKQHYLHRTRQELLTEETSSIDLAFQQALEELLTTFGGELEAFLLGSMTAQHQ
jgi:hypothetical protein